MLVAGLDLARRRDHSALVLLDVEPGRLTVTCCATSAAGAVARAVRPDRTTPRRARPPRLRSERPRRRRCGTAAENTAAHRRLPDRRRSPARPLSARRPPGRREVVADPAARRRYAERSPNCRGACARPRSFAPGDWVSSSSSWARVAGSAWRRLAAMTTLSSRRRSPCWRRILRRSMLLPNQSRSPLTCEDTNCVAVGSALQK